MPRGSDFTTSLTSAKVDSNCSCKIIQPASGNKTMQGLRPFSPELKGNSFFLREAEEGDLKPAPAGPPLKPSPDGTGEIQRLITRSPSHLNKGSWIPAGVGRAILRDGICTMRSSLPALSLTASWISEAGYCCDSAILTSPRGKMLSSCCASGENCTLFLYPCLFFF